MKLAFLNRRTGSRRERLEKILLRRPSVMAFPRLTLDHLLWPAMGEEGLKERRTERLKEKTEKNGGCAIRPEF